VDLEYRLNKHIYMEVVSIMSDLESIRNRQSTKLNSTNISKILILSFLIKDGSCYGYELSAKIEATIT